MRRRALLGLSLSTLFAPAAARAQGWDELYLPSTGDDSSSAKALEMPDGPSDVVFLRAVPDKLTAYVGEQITFSVYLYFRVAYEMSERNDAKFADFLRFPLLSDPGATTPVYTRVKGVRYGARLVERVALIPLRAGKVQSGSMTARFKGRDIGARVLKASNDVTFDIIEPPLEGRPKNYIVGDVGQFTVSASIKPRTTSQGGSVGVIIKVEGVGNIPTNITPPPVPGGKWLEPRRRDAVTGKTGKVAGARYFDYVLRLGNAGTTDLGTLEVPYFDPVKKKYELAKTALGQVEVQEVAATDSEIDRAKRKGDGSDPLKGLPAHKPSLVSFTPRKDPELPLSWLAMGVVVPPTLALLVLGAGRARGVVKERRNTEASALKQKLKEALRDAKDADRKKDARAVSSAVERAVHAAIEIRTGVKSRALRMSELAASLREAGVGEAEAEEARALLSECEGMRFAPSVDEDARSALHERGRALTKKLS